jgi:hypothetical protein
MPALSVTLNGEFLVSVATPGFEIVEVGVTGDLLGPQHATLRISGGSYSERKQQHHLIWDQRTLVPGDSVTVGFLAEGSTSEPGKTIEELYQGDKPVTSEPFAPPEDVVKELKLRPKAFQSLAFEFVGADGAHVKGHTSPDEHGFAFTVLWNSHRIDRARVALHTYTLDSLITKQSGKYHAETRLSAGQRVTFKVLAPNSTVERDARKSGARPHCER